MHLSCIRCTIAVVDATRTYDRSLRDAQAAATRSAIVTAAGRVAAVGIEQFTMAAVARDAGVSLRTLYNHFPARADLLAEVLTPPSAVLPGLAGVSLSTPEELLYRLKRAVAAHAARFVPRPGAPEALKARDAQQAVVAAGLAPVLRSLGPRERQRILNAVLLLSDARATETCRDALGLDAAESAQLIVWSIEALIERATNGAQ